MTGANDSTVVDWDHIDRSIIRLATGAAWLFFVLLSSAALISGDPSLRIQTLIPLAVGITGVTLLVLGRPLPWLQIAAAAASLILVVSVSDSELAGDPVIGILIMSITATLLAHKHAVAVAAFGALALAGTGWAWHPASTPASDRAVVAFSLLASFVITSWLMLYLKGKSLESQRRLEDLAAAQRQLIQELDTRATTDSLTGLPNRYALYKRLQIELVRARRLGTRVAVLLIDLDHFKDVNDTFGHPVGDQLLVEVGSRLRETLRDADPIGRIGGDEFAVVQTDIPDRANARQLAEKLLRVFGTSFDVESQEIFAGASIGVTISDRENTSVTELVQQADLALYRAKDDGRNTYRFFEGAMDVETKRRMTLAQDLRRGIAANEFFLVYQPQVRLTDRRILGVEALLRWRHPTLGILAPTEVVPIAESAGLIDELGEWVLREACGQARMWQSRNLPLLPVAVNVSGTQLRDPRFASKVSRTLADCRLEPQCLELELTESVLMDANENVDEVLQTLHELGVGIALDDFGRGYASLDYLRRYPFSKVKIDKSFVGDMLTNFKNATIVRAVIDLAAKLELHVIAEGVEPIGLLQRLSDEGCEAIQGFYFSRPVSPETVEQLITRGSERIRSHPVGVG